MQGQRSRRVSSPWKFIGGTGLCLEMITPLPQCGAQGGAAGTVLQFCSDLINILYCMKPCPGCQEGLVLLQCLKRCTALSIDVWYFAGRFNWQCYLEKKHNIQRGMKTVYENRCDLGDLIKGEKQSQAPTASCTSCEAGKRAARGYCWFSTVTPCSQACVLLK